jgi:DHA2 family multidrug resistance protein
MIERREHFHFSVLAEAMTQNAILTQQRLGAMVVAMQAHVIDPIAAHAQALNLIAAQVRREAYVMAYSDAFWIVGVGLIVSLVAITLLRKPPRVAGPVEAH